MKNNVYVRSKKSIANMSITRIILLIPLIIFGLYKNGVYLYLNKYTNIGGFFKPMMFIILGALIGALVNIIYEYIFKRNKDNIISVLFSSFHIEYGILLACITSVNTNVFVFMSVVFVMLFISKILKNRINIMSITFIVIYFIQQQLFGGYTYLNAYDTSRVFSLDFMDFMIGRGYGGIATTHIILLIIALIGITVTNNNKSNISISSAITIFLLFGIYSIANHMDIGKLILNNSYMFACVYIMTDYVTSSYTKNGEIIFGVLCGLLTFTFYFINPIIAPYIAITIVSLFNNLIDRLCNKTTYK
jgi:Na+-translocating ferredoxin:NAD+ oxidoreductase RnfD subunit